MGYLWTIIDKPIGANATLSEASSAGPTLSVDSTGEYTLGVRIFGDSWESPPIIVRLAATGAVMAAPYNAFVPVPVKTRVVTGVGDRYQDYSIRIGSNTYTAPAPASCGSPGNSGFQVLVLDRATLVKRDHRSFNMPCGRDAMTTFLAGLDDTSMVIVSSLYVLDPYGTCLFGSLCLLLRDFGGTTALSLTTPVSFTMPGGSTAMFSYSLIGIPHLGAFQGTELNNWDHKPFTMSSKIYSNIEGSFVYENVNRKWTFVYTEFVEIETRANASETDNTIKAGGVSFDSLPLTMLDAAGGFQVVVLEKDTLREFPWFMGANNTFFTNCGSGAGSVGESEQKRMYDYLHDWTLGGDPKQQYVVVIAGIGTPIGYKSTYFTDLVKLIGNYYGGTIGVLNQLGPGSSYSLVGLTRPGFAAYPIGATDSVEANSAGENLNLRTVMQRDRQGWFKPAVTDKVAAGAAPSQGRPDFSLLSVALQPYTPWPLPDPSHPLYAEEVAAYQYISRNLGAGSVADSDIRSVYTGGSTTPDTWLMFCNYPILKYENIPAAERSFSAGVYDAVWQQLCGTDGEFNYLNQVNAFKADLDIALLSMQASSNPDLANVYEMVRGAIPVESGNQVLYDAGMVLRGLLTTATSIVTDPLLKGGMGAPQIRAAPTRSSHRAAAAAPIRSSSRAPARVRGIPSRFPPTWSGSSCGCTSPTPIHP